MGAPTKEQFNKKGTNFPIPLITLWKQKGKSGVSYFTGFHKQNHDVLGFFNSKKNNPKQPDLDIYLKNEDGKRGDLYASLWVNVSETKGTKYCAGYLKGDDKIKITGFINKSENPKAPYLKIYLSSELEEHKEKVDKEKGKQVLDDIEQNLGVVEEDII